MQNEVLDFINRRFKKNCNWLTGNCYYFALILKDRFPEGTIYYDVISGHFMFEYMGGFYDWTGLIDMEYFDGILIVWDTFENYDHLEKERIIRDCIK